MLEKNVVYYDDCRNILKHIDSESVQCVVTSPPYWGLRDYGNEADAIWGGDSKCKYKYKYKYHSRNMIGGFVSEPFDKTKVITTKFCEMCGAWKGQLGLEETPERYVDNLIEIFSEIKRVLKNDGTIWLNLGDTYYFGGGASRHKGYSDPKYPNGRNGEFEEPQTKTHTFLKSKDLCGIPWRVAFALQERLGLYLRQAIIWHKPNAMPSSVKDRPVTDYEFIFFLTKYEKYYYDSDSIKEPYTKPMNRWGGTELKADGKSSWDEGTGQVTYRKRNMRPAPDGRNCRSVWSFSTKPFKGAHFAVFPEELPERCIKVGTKEGDIVLDPFAGSGTTLWVAKKLGRNYIGIEYQKKYADIIKKRLKTTLKDFSYTKILNKEKQKSEDWLSS